MLHEGDAERLLGGDAEAREREHDGALEDAEVARDDREQRREVQHGEHEIAAAMGTAQTEGALHAEIAADLGRLLGEREREGGDASRRRAKRLAASGRTRRARRATRAGTTCASALTTSACATRRRRALCRAAAAHRQQPEQRTAPSSPGAERRRGEASTQSFAIPTSSWSIASTESAAARSEARPRDEEARRAVASPTSSGVVLSTDDVIATTPSISRGRVLRRRGASSLHWSAHSGRIVA